MLIDLLKKGPLDDDEDSWTVRKASASLLDRLSSLHLATIEPILTRKISMVLSHGDASKYEQTIFLIGIAQQVYCLRSDLLATWFSFLIEKMEHTVRIHLHVNSQNELVEIGCWTLSRFLMVNVITEHIQKWIALVIRLHLHKEKCRDSLWYKHSSICNHSKFFSDMCSREP